MRSIQAATTGNRSIALQRIQTAINDYARTTLGLSRSHLVPVEDLL